MRQMTVIDLFYIAKEMQFLSGYTIEKICHSGGKVLLRLSSGNKEVGLLITQEGLRISSEKIQEETDFSMTLRKYLKGRKISRIQPGYYSVLIDTDGGSLACEFVQRGNVILLDTEGRIIIPMKFQKWYGRSVMPKDIYKQIQISASLNENAGDFAEKRFGIYADDVLNAAGIRKNDVIDPGNAGRLDLALKQILSKEADPRIIFSGRNFLDFTAIPAKRYSQFKSKKFGTFSSAMEVFISNTKSRDRLEEEKNALAQQRAMTEDYRRKASQEAAKLNTMKENKDELGQMVRDVKSLSARKVFRVQDILYGNKFFRGFDEKKGIVKAALGNFEIDLPVSKSIEDNIKNLSERVKFLEKKKDSMENETQKICDRITKIEMALDDDTQKSFTMSDGFIVAETEKYSADDVIVQANGGSMMVIKAPNGMFTEQSVKEAAQMAVCKSPCWPANKTGSVCWKFRGADNFLSEEPRLACGIVSGRLRVEPLTSMARKTEKFVAIKPGFTDPRKLALKIKEKLFNEASGLEKKIIEDASSSNIAKMIPGNAEIA